MEPGIEPGLKPETVPDSSALGGSRSRLLFKLPLATAWLHKAAPWRCETQLQERLGVRARPGLAGPGGGVQVAR